MAEERSREDVVKEMLKKGILLSPEALDALERRPELAAAVHRGSGVVTPHDFANTQRDTLPDPMIPVEHAARPALPRPKILWSTPEKRNHIQVNALAEAYAARHAFFRSLLEPKADQSMLVSVAHASAQRARVSIIGIVREAREGHVVVEDGTGSLRVTTTEKLMEDEGVLITGVVGPDGLRAETIDHPDVPIGRPVKTTELDVRCFFTHTIPREVRDCVVFLLGRDVDSKELEALAQNNTVVWPDGASPHVPCPAAPCLFDLDGVRVMLHRTTAAALTAVTGIREPERAAIRLLRARHLEPQRYVSGDPLLLRELPDIICLATDVPFMTNYKGITIVSPAVDAAYLINTKTREVVTEKL